VSKSAFDEQKVRDLAEIPVQPSRGRRESFFPFKKNWRSFGLALQRAQRAFDQSLQQQRIEGHCTQLKLVFEEQRRFLSRYNSMICSWQSLSELAKKDIAARAEHFLAIRELGDDEHQLAQRSRQSADALVVHFDNILTAVQEAAAANGRATLEEDPSKKKDRLGAKSLAPLREFTYVLKLHWDRTMMKSVGPDFKKKFAFSRSHELVFEAVSVLTDNYSELEVKRIIRSVQVRNYDPNEFRMPLPGGVNLLEVLRPELAPSPR
jgi:hypothetical protein